MQLHIVLPRLLDCAGGRVNACYAADFYTDKLCTRAHTVSDLDKHTRHGPCIECKSIPGYCNTASWANLIRPSQNQIILQL